MEELACVVVTQFLPHPDISALARNFLRSHARIPGDAQQLTLAPTWNHRLRRIARLSWIRDKSRSLFLDACESFVGALAAPADGPWEAEIPGVRSLWENRYCSNYHSPDRTLAAVLNRSHLDVR